MHEFCNHETKTTATIDGRDVNIVATFSSGKLVVKSENEIQMSNQ